MEKEKIQNWLTTIAGAVKTLVENADIDEEICICSFIDAEMHMSKGTRKIANLLGLELHEKAWQCEDATATHISFVYEGVKFFELEGYKKGEV